MSFQKPRSSLIKFVYLCAFLPFSVKKRVPLTFKDLKKVSQKDIFYINSLILLSVDLGS